MSVTSCRSGNCPSSATHSPLLLAAAAAAGDLAAALGFAGAAAGFAGAGGVIVAKYEQTCRAAESIVSERTEYTASPFGVYMISKLVRSDNAFQIAFVSHSKM